ncbi:GNAT family N-acetyltransferase [Pseudalkalibacillus caeni]|uniref:GNAT family N-acetyltransferase n=1 Tax=Exobacillus caeni TaxID=2574798 RepID=A0A5R9F8U9_9BACL|nr:GNAT family N-acetyltransferase [Pseudalkalibacillus caeni]TLS36954.1 GNAT family N-acetyltransferase [Pseudalkalibacillus caeni]
MENTNQIKICNSLEGLDWGELVNLFETVEWKGRTKENLQQAFHSSYYVALLYDDNRLIGCGRVISDGVFYGAVYDVIIHPDYQGKGIGRKLMANILSKMDDVNFIHLTTTEGREPFYEKLGLRKHKTAMARYLDPEPAKKYLEEARFLKE